MTLKQFNAKHRTHNSMIGYHKLGTTVARLCKMAGIAEQGYMIKGSMNSWHAVLLLVDLH